MAQKRMFDKTITNSDDFIDMPDSAQNLYFHLSMNADDDGFVNNWKNIMRMTGHKEDDMKILIAKQYIIPFDSGVIVIKHWRINNYLRGDRYTETKFKAEKQQLQVDESLVYQLATNGIPSGIPRIDKNSIEENRVEENSIEESVRGEKKSPPPLEKFIDIYARECFMLPQVRSLTDNRKKAIRAFLKQYTIENWEEVCKIASTSDFLCGKNDRGWKADFDFLINVNKATRVLEGKYSGKPREGPEEGTSNPFLKVLMEMEEENDTQGNNANTGTNEDVIPEILSDYSVE